MPTTPPTPKVGVHWLQSHKRARLSLLGLAGVLVLPLACHRGGAQRNSEPQRDNLVSAVHKGELNRLTSVLLRQHDKVLFEQYFGGTDANTLHDPRSAMKTVTALAIGVAVDEGKIADLKRPALGFLSDLAPFAHRTPRKENITIEDLLTMASALACDDDDPKSPGNEENMYPRRHWTRWAVDLPTVGDWQRDAKGRGPFSYCTAGTLLLGQILQRASGVRVDHYIQQKLLTPLAIKRWRWPRSPSGEIMTGGGLRLTTQALAKLGRLILEDGRWDGRQVVTKSWIDRMTTALHRPFASQPGKDDIEYGFLIWRRVYTTPCGRIPGWYMSGNGGNHVVMLDTLQAVAVVTAVNYNTRGMHEQTVRILENHLFPRLTCPAND